MAIQRRYPFSWMMKDFEDMLAEIEGRLWGPGGRFLPAAGVTDRVLPAIRGEFRVDVRDNDDEIMVVADLPGVDKEDISIALLSPNTSRFRARGVRTRRSRTKGTMSGRGCTGRWPAQSCSRMTSRIRGRLQRSRTESWRSA